MNKEAKDPVKEMLRKDDHQRILEALVKFSAGETGTLHKHGAISAIAKQIYPGRREYVAKVASAIETFSKPPYGIITVNGSNITVTEKTLKYASRK
jgi:hypothetical protein